MGNQALFLSLFACIALVAVCASGTIPYLNETLNLEIVPEGLRWQVMGALFVSLVGSFLWDRLMVFIFARHIFDATLQEAKSTKFSDVMPILQTVGYIVGGLLVLSTGNLIFLGIAYMMYRNYKKGQADKESAAADKVKKAQEAKKIAEELQRKEAEKLRKEQEEGNLA